MAPDRVWYVAYGSNLNRDRFGQYLAAARDPSPPTADFFSQVGLRLSFGNRSIRWNGGGVCFVFPDPNARCWVRAWSITTDQFEDVFAQENRLPIATALDWSALGALVPGPGPGCHIDVGTGWYRRIIRVAIDELDDRQDRGLALTFTSARPVELNPPDPDYRATIAAGLVDNPVLGLAEVEAYIDGCVPPD